ncbi:tautomerase family protein [Streptomyces sp. NPDC003758]
MPFVRIDLIRGLRPDEVRAIADATHQALLDVLDIPERDRFQVITEHDADHVIALDAGLGFERSDRLVMIQIFTQSGRTTEVKQRLFHTIAEQLEPLGIRGEESSSASWRTALRTGRSASDAPSTPRLPGRTRPLTPHHQGRPGTSRRPRPSTVRHADQFVGAGPGGRWTVMIRWQVSVPEPR